MERERLLLDDVVEYITTRDKIMVGEEKSKYSVLKLTPAVSIAKARLRDGDDIAIDAATKRARCRLDDTVEKLAGIVENVQLGDPHLPLWWYDRWYADTKWTELNATTLRPPRYALTGPESSCDLCLLYGDRSDDDSDDAASLHHRYMCVSVIDTTGDDGSGVATTMIWRSAQTTPGAIPFRARDNSLIVRRRIVLLDNVGVVYELDMRDDYAQQTRSTPFIVSSIDGASRYLVNRDSYCTPTRNRFAFVVSL